jgi:hypothetical protein
MRLVGYTVSDWLLRRGAVAQERRLSLENRHPTMNRRGRHDDSDELSVSIVHRDKGDVMPTMTKGKDPANYVGRVYREVRGPDILVTSYDVEAESLQLSSAAGEFWLMSKDAVHRFEKCADVTDESQCPTGLVGCYQRADHDGRCCPIGDAKTKGR